MSPTTRPELPQSTIESVEAKSHGEDLSRTRDEASQDIARRASRGYLIKHLSDFLLEILDSELVLLAKESDQQPYIQTLGA
jgi:hypothetical protein